MVDGESFGLPPDWMMDERVSMSLSPDDWARISASLLAVAAVMPGNRDLAARVTVAVARGYQ